MSARRSRSAGELDRLRRRFRRLAGQLSPTGWLLQGSVAEREIRRGRIAARAKRYGPYYQWTFKQEGKTITVQLSAEQASVYRRAIEQQRKVEAILSEMRRLSEAFLSATTEGVPKRNRHSP